jgi:hypothetical protein
MKKALNWLKSLLSDERGSVSSKRVVGIMCAIFLCITMYHNSFSDEHIAPSESLVQSVALLAFGCLGLTSIDKFTFKGKSQEDKSEEKPKSE